MVYASLWRRQASKARSTDAPQIWQNLPSHTMQDTVTVLSGAVCMSTCRAADSSATSRRGNSKIWGCCRVAAAYGPLSGAGTGSQWYQSNDDKGWVLGGAASSGGADRGMATQLLTWKVESKPAQSITTSGPWGGSSLNSSSAMRAGDSEGGVSSAELTPTCLGPVFFYIVCNSSGPSSLDRKTCG